MSKIKLEKTKETLKLCIKKNEPNYISGRLHSHLEKKYFAYAILFVK